MTLRTRLTTAFLAVVFGPVLLGAVFVGATVTAVSADRAEHQLDLSAGATRSAVGSLCQQLGSTAEAVSLHPPERRAAVAAALAGGVRRPDPVAGVRILDGQGGQILLTESAPPLPWADCAQPPRRTRSGYGAIAARVSLPGAEGEVWVAARLDQAMVERLTAATGAEVTLVDRTDAVHSTSTAPQASIEAARALAPGEVGQSADGHRVRRLDPTAGQPLPLVLSVPGTELRGLYALLIGVVAVTGGLAVLAAWRLARSTTRQIGRAHV